MIKACIFDLDGVIVDTAHYHFLAWKRLAAEHGINLTKEDNEKLKGVSRMKSLDIILELGNKKFSEEEKEKLADKKNKWFVEFINAMSADEIFPGAKNLLQMLRDKGYKIGLASSSKNAHTVIGLLKIQSLFDAVVDGNMVTNSKPDPEIFLLASKKLNVAPEQCLVFEDAEAGVEAAIAAGMKCVGIGSSDQLGKADLVLSTTGSFRLDMVHQLETA